MHVVGRLSITVLKRSIRLARLSSVAIWQVIFLSYTDYFIMYNYLNYMYKPGI